MMEDKMTIFHVKTRRRETSNALARLQRAMRIVISCKTAALFAAVAASYYHPASALRPLRAKGG